MKRHLMPAAALVTVLVLVLFAPATAFSQLSEGFEDGIPNTWTFSGPVGLDGTAQAPSGITPTEGSYFGWISNGCSGAAGTTCPAAATLATPSYLSLGLTPGPDLGTPSFETVLTSPQFTLTSPGGLISFDVNFITTDGSYTFADFALVQLVPSEGSPINLFVANTTTATAAAVPPDELSPGVATISPATAFFAGTTVTFGATIYGNVPKYGTDPSCEPASAGPIAPCPGGPTGWMHVTYSAPAGTYTLQFMVSHLTDTGYPSALAIDNVQTSAEQELTLTELGLGTGTVTDNTGQINCSEANGIVTGTCSASYAIGTPVILTASPNSPSPSTPPSTFGGWGGACASSGTNLTCDLTMTSAQNVIAIFNVAGPTQVGTVTTGTETVLDFEGGVANGGTGYDYNAQLTSGSSVTAQVTAIPVASQSTCNSIVNPTFPGAQCFVYQNANGPGTNLPVMFELTCPPGTCGSNDNPFNATLGTDFNFASALNPFNPTEPLVGWLKGVGPDPLHPCTQNPGNSPPLFQSNQISSFSSTGDPIGTAKGGSGGTGSCWLLTYSTPYEAPLVTIAAPANGGTYQQGQVTQANYGCTAVNNSNINGGIAGPYLTQASCSATDSPGGSVAQGAQFDTTTPGPHTFTATVVDSASNTVSQTATYNVVGAADVAILKLAAPKVATGSKLTYFIGVADFGPANAVGVVVTDTLPSSTTFVSASGNKENCGITNGHFSCSSTPVTCSGTGTVTCNIGTLMPLSWSSLNGATVQITVTVTAAKGTTIRNTATVSELNADPKPGSNSSTASTLVTAH
ncbi:MAG: DUF11 domain-containing protein [Terriglobales bacterium]